MTESARVLGQIGVILASFGEFIEGVLHVCAGSAAGGETHHEGSKEGKAHEEEVSFDGINRIDRMGRCARAGEQVSR